MISKKRLESIEEEPSSKAARRDFAEPTTEIVDQKLAEKFDKLLQLRDKKSPFVPNKLKQEDSSSSDKSKDDKKPKLSKKQKPSVEELLKKYDTLISEGDTKKGRPIKVLSHSESLEVAKVHAKNEYEREMYLNSVAGNLAAFKSSTAATASRQS